MTPQQQRRHLQTPLAARWLQQHQLLQQLQLRPHLLLRCWAGLDLLYRAPPWLCHLATSAMELLQQLRWARAQQRSLPVGCLQAVRAHWAAAGVHPLQAAAAWLLHLAWRP